MPEETRLTDDMLIAWGGAIKALGDGRIGGLGVRFTEAGDTDLEGERFTPKTYYGAHDGDGADYRNTLAPFLSFLHRQGGNLHQRDGAPVASTCRSSRKRGKTGLKCGFVRRGGRNRR